MTQPLADRKVLVTGAASGIGRAIALELARNGFDLAVNDASPGSDLDSAVRDVAATGARALALPFDVSDLKSHAPALMRLEEELGTKPIVQEMLLFIRESKRGIIRAMDRSGSEE